MGYERFIFWFWESPTTGWHACKVKKQFNFLIICIYFYLICSTTPKTVRSMIHFSKPLLCVTLICGDWSDWLISFKAEHSVVYSVTGETAIVNAPKAAPSGNKWAGNMLMFHDDVEMKRLKIRFENDSFQWFRVDSFFWETIGAFDFMQRHENRSAADLKQCMPVRKFVRLEPAPTPRHCHVWHQSTARAFPEQPAHSVGAVSPEWLRERWWRHNCFTIGQTHHMTTMTCVSNIFNSNTAHKSVFRTVKVFFTVVAMLYWVTFNIKNTDKSKYTPTLLVFK